MEGIVHLPPVRDKKRKAVTILDPVKHPVKSIEVDDLPLAPSLLDLAINVLDEKTQFCEIIHIPYTVVKQSAVLLTLIDDAKYRLSPPEVTKQDKERVRHWNSAIRQQKTPPSLPSSGLLDMPIPGGPRALKLLINLVLAPNNKQAKDMVQTHLLDVMACAQFLNVKEFSYLPEDEIKRCVTEIIVANQHDPRVWSVPICRGKAISLGYVLVVTQCKAIICVVMCVQKTLCGQCLGAITFVP
jgi:hypothetical protein